MRSGGTRGAVVSAVLGAVAVLVLGACGTQVAGRGKSASPTGPVPWTLAQPSAVTGARLSGDGRTLLVDAQVPSGARPCVRGLKAVLTEPVENSVRVQITFSSPSGDTRSGCTKEKSATTKVRLSGPLGGREVVVDNDVQFTAEGARPPALRLCGRLGCTPPATGCTAASYDQALIAVDAPEHTYRDSQDCDGRWMVMDFSWRTGPACDGDAAPGCSSRLGDRWFFKAEKSGWVPIAEGAAGGCRTVQRREPAFPTSMCRSLAPLSPSLHPSYPPASPAPGRSSASASPSPS
ncbi:MULTISPECIES: hypothetical protein [unclassified Streptomyces]|uniref:hypothetical protein n=1 Tax=unclassified Streptomyces TaxID=2593676 RepID=UPI00225A6F11|nr:MULTISPECIES: hypothetical protein [unclassified Streptomyces]MCX5054157.1 hypothetical protein [Streptomyces sp. NBC_00474]